MTTGKRVQTETEEAAHWMLTMPVRNLANVSWSSDEIAALFTSPNDDDDSRGTGSSTPVGAIVGGTIGGVAGLAACGGIAWYLLRRKRKQGQSVPFDAADSGKSTGQQPPEMSLPGREESAPYSNATSEARRVASPSELPGPDVARPPFEMEVTRGPGTQWRGVDP